MSKRFFVLGGYLSFNPGDLAILKATIARLNRLHPGSHFVIWCDKTDFTAQIASNISHEYFVHPCPSFFMGAGSLARLFLRLYLLTYPFSQSIVRRFGEKKYGAVVQKIKSCDDVLFIGGGYLNSNYPFDLMQLHHLNCLANESGRPVYLLGQTVGPFKSRWYRNIAESIFRGAEKIVTRERYSSVELANFSEKVLDGIDDAVDFAESIRLGEKTDPHVVLGLNLRITNALNNDVMVQLVNILNQFNLKSAGGRLKVIFIPMVTSSHADDRYEAEKFKQIPNKNFEFRILSGPLTLEDRVLEIAKTDLLLSMRFHSLVFALSTGTPCIGLYASDYYLRKNLGLLEAYGMERYCLPLEHLAKLPALLDEVLVNKTRIRADLISKHTTIIRGQEAIYRSLFP